MHACVRLSYARLCLGSVVTLLADFEFFRGLLVQGRTVADGSPVGEFIDDNPNTRLSSCTQQEVHESSFI